jgi:hypothetical protein
LRVGFSFNKRKEDEFYDILMLNKREDFCRVCGYFDGEYPWGEDGITATFELCPCCGVEHGYQDCSVEVIKSFRKLWIDGGAQWLVRALCPTDWHLNQQLARISGRYLDTLQSNSTSPWM